jgi:DNA ligase-associated metallophosphoesterase
VPDVSGALMLSDSATLVVSDLHFEKGSAFAARGIHLPPYDTRSSLGLLEEVCRRLAPARVISLGDSFHDGGARGRMADGDLARIRALTVAHAWTWVVGNHDPEPPADLGGTVAETVEIGPLLLRHEPRPAPATGEIAGHLHPAASVIVRGRHLRRRCFVTDGTRLIMPAFGAYTGGLDVLSEPFGGLFDGCSFEAWMIGRDRVYPVSGRRLR